MYIDPASPTVGTSSLNAVVSWRPMTTVRPHDQPRAAPAREWERATSGTIVAFGGAVTQPFYGWIDLMSVVNK